MERRTRTDDVMQVLRDEVLSGQYRPGERLPSERDLAERFGTTRGVVRVALKKLEQLGVADVQPGGTRVVPVEEASLDVVGYLLDLESPPDPDLVDQVLEVVGALMAATARIAVERGEVSHLERARELVERLGESGLSDETHLEIANELRQVFMDASDNVVLQIVRRGLRTQVFEHLADVHWHVRSDAAYVERMAKELAGAIDDRDPARASEAVHSLWRSLRKGVRRSLIAAREAEGAEILGGSAR